MGRGDRSACRACGAFRGMAARPGPPCCRPGCRSRGGREVNAARAARQPRRVMTLPARQSTARTRLARLAIGWVFFANGAALGSWVPHIPDAKHALGLTDGLLGLALLGMATGSLVGLPLSG